MVSDQTDEARERQTWGTGAEPWKVPPPDADVLAKALHELEVHQTELEMQNHELRETQTALGQARDRYRALFDESLVPLVVMSPAGVVLDANREATTLFERPLARLSGKPLVVCLDGGALETFFRHLEGVLESKVPQVTELVVRQVNAPSRVVVARSCLLSGPGEILCHFTDVTDQRAALRDKEAMQERLREAEKLEAIGRVAANIAHDVNNVLVSVIAIGEFVKEDLRDREQAHDMETLLDAAWRGARLMRGLLGLSRRSLRPSRVIDMVPLVERVVCMSRRTKPGVKVVWEKPTVAACVRGDEEELLQALLNVATNGLDAMDEGTLTFSCKTVVPDDDPAEPCVQMTIADTGVGMTEEVRRRVFEPLFTTKSRKGGTGLGMTQVYRTIDAHHGRIELASAVGKGTTVTISLPQVAQAADPEVSETDVSSFGRKTTIVLVDDDESVRRSAKRQLGAAGATVHAFANGRSALEALRRDRTLADVVLVDVDMPEMSGPELAQAILDELGDLPVVFITGASGGIVPTDLLRRSKVALVRKPWTRAELVQTIHAAIEGRR